MIALAVAALSFVPAASATLAEETALAERYAPVVRLSEREDACNVAVPYKPTDVDVLFDEPTVALRGPWNATDLVKIGPSAEDLVGLYRYHLDFPGDALNPGCGYELWTQRITKGSKPTVYAHVATDPGHPGKLSLQYWFFYTFNDFKNLHEGDWEMIQLIFDADDAAQALERGPVEVGYSQHESAEHAAWGDGKLEIVDGTHPVVYPATGSHANFFGPALNLGRSTAGVGCDDTRGPHLQIDPRVVTIPSDGAAARAAYPWIAFEGRWGELQKAFFNGPTGPNLKEQWTEPIRWSETWKPRSYAVPTGGVFGTRATDFFCGAVARVSGALVRVLRNPGLTVLVLVGLLALAAFAVTRTTWRPAAPLRLARRRTWGQVVSASGRMYVGRPWIFLGIGVLLIPVGIVISVLQALLLGGFGLVGIDASGESGGLLVLAAVAVGTTLTLLGFSLVEAATACALVELDEGRPIGPIGAYRLALKRIRPLFGTLAVAVFVVIVVTATWVLIPIAIWLVVRWLLLAPVVVLERLSAIASLRRSTQLVRGRWLRVGSLVGIGALLALAAGPFFGALLILTTDAPLPLLNVVAGGLYALAMPFVGLITSYVYLDARVREGLALEPAELPAEIDLAGPARG